MAKRNPVELWRGWFRPLCPGEADGERLFALLFPVTAGLLVAWMAFGLPTPKCAFHELTGFPCASCGATRALGSLLRGEWLQAIRWNPGVIGAGYFLAMAWAYSAIVCLFRWRRFRPPLSRRFQHALRVAIVALVAANWIYLIRMIP